MAIERLAIIGSRGHYGVVLNELGTMRDVRVVGLADGGDTVDPIVAWCREHGHGPERFDDHRAMLDRVAPDAVVVCGPFERHAEMCADAIARGAHVLTEKPAALTFEQLDQLRGACDRHPNVHLAGMMFSRYDVGFYTACQLVRGGAVGDVRHVDARKSYKIGKRAAYYHDRATYGGTIPWVGSHAVDWVMWIVGQPFESVYATHSTRDNGGNGTMERAATCHFTLAGERTASVSIDVFRPDRAPTHGDDWLRVVGTAGVIEARPDSVSLVNKDHDGSKPIPVACDRRPVEDFLAHAGDRRASIIDRDQTLELTRACLLARQSADERRVLPLAPAR